MKCHANLMYLAGISYVRHKQGNSYIFCLHCRWVTIQVPPESNLQRGVLQGATNYSPV